MEGFRQEASALIVAMRGETVRIEPWGKDSLRVRATMAPTVIDGLPGALLEPAPVSAQIEIGPQQAIIRNGAITAEVHLSGNIVTGFPTPVIRFLHSGTGAELLAEGPAHFPRPAARRYHPLHGNLYRMEMRFRAYDGERITAWASTSTANWTRRGWSIDQLQVNTEVCIPFLFSNRGYGFLWNNPAVGRVELGEDKTRWVAEATPQLDYWITAG